MREKLVQLPELAHRLPVLEKAGKSCSRLAKVPRLSQISKGPCSRSRSVDWTYQEIQSLTDCSQAFQVWRASEVLSLRAASRCWLSTPSNSFGKVGLASRSS